MHRPATARPRVVVYYRTGLPTLDLEGQRRAVDCWGWIKPFDAIAEFTEIEDKASKNRPQLGLAISRALEAQASVLIAYTGMLTRDITFLKTLANASRAHGIEFYACGLFNGESIPCDLMLTMTECCAKSHSDLTRESLAAAKARGVKLGAAASGHVHVATAAKIAKAADGRAKHLSIINQIQRHTGARTLQAIADALMAQGVKTPRGLEKWCPKTVSRIIGPVRGKKKAAA